MNMIDYCTYKFGFDSTIDCWMAVTMQLQGGSKFDVTVL